MMPTTPEGTVQRLLESTSRRTEARAGALLRLPWTWPADPSLAARAGAIEPSGPERPRNGQALLVSFDGNVGTPWCMTILSDTSDRGAALDPETRALLKRQITHAYSRVDYAVRPPPSAEVRIEVLRPVDSSALLKGESFGAALWTAAASFALGRPPRGDTAVIATCGADGLLGPVDGLEAKFSAIIFNALAVERIVVSEAQKEEASGLIRRLSPSRTIVVLGAIRCIDLPEQVLDLSRPHPDEWETPDGRARALEELSAIIQSPQTTLRRWSPFAEAARRLGARYPEGSTERVRAEQLHGIARRHDDNDGVFNRSPEWATLPLLRRLGEFMQEVQSRADNAPNSLPSLIAEADRLLPHPTNSDVMQLRTHGAVARAEVVLGRRRQAFERLAPVVDSWLGSPEFFAEATRPLSLWLTAAGIDRNVEELAAARDRAGGLRDRLREVAPEKFVYVEVAEARGLIQCGSFEEGRERLLEARHLMDQRPGEIQPHLRAACARWEAFACRGLGDEAGAREAILTATVIPTEPSGMLALVDAAIHSGVGLEDAVSKVEHLDKLVAWYAPASSRVAAMRLCREYPY